LFDLLTPIEEADRANVFNIALLADRLLDAAHQLDGQPEIDEDVIRLSGIDEALFNAVCNAELAEIERRRQKYLDCRERVNVTGRTVVVIDDGIATGATTRAALRATRMRNPKKLVLAVPVIPTDTLAATCEEADEVICLEDHAFFQAIGFYYRDFRQISDAEVIETLRRFSIAKRDETRAQLPAA
jgi:predicted phosphoribosyltransferase